MHVLAVMLAHAAPPPGVFKVFGYKIPTLLGELFHIIARFFKVVAVVIVLGLLYLQGKVGLWQMLFCILIGMIAIPSWSPRVSKFTASINHGSAVGSTGASAGIVILLAAMLIITFYMTIVRRRGAEQTEEVG